MAPDGPDTGQEGTLRPAREYDIRFGHGLLKADSSRWPDYVVVTTPSAWKAAQPFLAKKPLGIGYNKWLDRQHLEEVAASLPDSAKLVVGLGAGRALDHAKLVAKRKGVPLVQVPSVVSTGAIIHGFVGNWTGRVITGSLAEVDCEYVVVDYDLVLAATEALNTAGLGDVLCGYAGISEWKYNAARGKGPAFDPQAVAGTEAHHREIYEGFPKTLGPKKQLTPESVRFIMKAVQDRDDRMLRHPAAPGADHAFCFTVEKANDRFWTHGETCALGAVIVAWHTGQSPEVLVDRLDRCKVRFRPRNLDMSKDQLRLGLEEMPVWMGDKAAGRDVDSVMRWEPVTGRRFEECWRWLSGA
jgi:glycerol dehydrogenase-like iron-containing ADH family enzyme